MTREPVSSYADVGLRQWDARERGHDQRCPCLPCADTRAALGLKPLKTAWERQVRIQAPVEAPTRRTVPLSVYRPVWMTVVAG